MEKLTARQRYLIAVIVMAVLMSGPFLALGSYAWFEGVEEHRAIFLQYL
ncbi:hypothetical protein [Polynucleobacter necessarius]|nr:hypothetical protein [Polynucleobacter necessarius]